MKLAFDNAKYLELQSNKILERVNQYDNKLYLEFGGKLFDDYHASRVLPGFFPDSKLRMLLTIKEKVEVLIVINANDIQANKVRRDLNISYESEVLRLIDAFRESGLYVGSVVVTQYSAFPVVDQFIHKLNNLGVKTYKHYKIESYPHDLSIVLSEEGFGKNEYVETIKPIVVVTAPGPGSGKMATCMSQLYHENKRGIKAGYAKYETFPVWNLPLKHPVNLAYEAATADLNDINMIDPYHFEAYNTTVVNYNRDVEVFPVVQAMCEKIYGYCPYKSPTDMGVNMVGFAIIDDQIVRKAAKDEIIRRYLNSICDFRNGKVKKSCIEKIAIIMRELNISVDDRSVVKAAKEKEELTGTPSAALQFEDGTIVTAKTSELFGCAAALILNSLKVASNISHDLEMLSRNVIEPIRDLKVQKLGNHNPRLHTDETLIALAISAQTNPLADLALKNIDKLKGCEVHSTVILPYVDENVFKKLLINVTTEPEFKARRLYRK